VKICHACGQRNWDRPIKGRQWRCDACTQVITKDLETHSFGDGNKGVTPPKFIPYDYLDDEAMLR